MFPYLSSRGSLFAWLSAFSFFSGVAAAQNNTLTFNGKFEAWLVTSTVFNCDGRRDVQWANAEIVRTATFSPPVPLSKFVCPGSSISGSIRFSAPDGEITATAPRNPFGPFPEQVTVNRSMPFSAEIQATVSQGSNTRFLFYEAAVATDVCPGKSINRTAAQGSAAINLRVDCDRPLLSVSTQLTSLGPLPANEILAYGPWPSVQVKGDDDFGGIATFTISARPVYKLFVRPEIRLSQSLIEFTRKPTEIPASTITTYFNTGNAALNFRAVATTDAGGPWLSFTATPGTHTDPQHATGTILVGGAGALSVRADPKGLTPGIYTGRITISADDANVSNQTLVVKLTVAGTPAQISFSKPELVIQGIAGGEPVKSSFLLSNPGETSLEWSASYPDLKWLSVSPQSGSLLPGRSIELTLTADPRLLPPKSYAASIRISDPAIPAKEIPLTFQVQPGNDQLTMLEDLIRPKTRVMFSGKGAPVALVVQWSLLSLPEGEVFVKLTDQSGEILDSRSTKISFGGNRAIYTFAQFLIPDSATEVRLQAGLSDPAGTTIKSTGPIVFTVVPTPKLEATLVCNNGDRAERVPLSPTPWWSPSGCTEASSEKPGVYGLQVKYESIGLVIAVEAAAFNQNLTLLSHSPAVPVTGVGEIYLDLPNQDRVRMFEPAKVLVYLAYSIPFQDVDQSEKIAELNYEFLRLDDPDPGRDTSLRSGSKVQFYVPLKFRLRDKHQIRREVSIARRTPDGNLGTSLNSGFTLKASGAGATLDDFEIDLPGDVHGISVEYFIVEEGSTRKVDFGVQSLSYSSFSPPPGVIEAGVNSLVNIASGKLENVASSAKKSLESAVFNYGIDKLDEWAPKYPSSTKNPTVQAQAVAGVIPEFTGMGKTWSLSPAIPKGSGFSADLTLIYLADELPGGGFDPAKLRVVSYDPTTGAYDFLATTVNTVSRQATAHIDSLAPYYSLVWTGPPASVPLHAIAIGGESDGDTLITATNLAETDSTLTIAGFGPGGNAIPFLDGQAAAIAVPRGGQILASSKRLFGPITAGWIRGRATGGGTIGLEAIAGPRGFEALPLLRSESVTQVLSPLLYKTGTDPELHLVNLMNQPQHVTITLKDGSGAATGSVTVELAASGKLVRPLNELLLLPSPFSGHVVIASNGPMTASLHTESQGALVVAPGRSLRPGSRSPIQLAAPAFDLSPETAVFVVLTNPTSLNARVLLKPYRSDGTSMAKAVDVAIAPGAQFRGEWTEVFGPPAPGETGWLAVESDLTGIAGDLVTGAREPLSGWATSVPLTEATTKSGVIPYVVNFPPVLNRIALANPSSARADVDLQFQRADGSTAGKARVGIPARGSMLQRLEAVIPETAGAISGYLLISSTQPVVAAEWLVPGAEDWAAVTMQPVPNSLQAAIPAITLSATSLDFGNVQTGQTKDLTFDISNTGGASLAVQNATLSDAQFRIVSPAVPFAVAAGAKQTVALRFVPTSAGNKTSTLTLSTNDPLSATVNLPLRGVGVAPACTYTISPTSASIAAAGGAGSITITASASTCAWTASSAVPWITFTSATSGTGAGAVTYSAAANTTTAQRIGTLTVAGQSFTLTQAAPAGGSPVTQDVVIQLDGGTFRSAAGVPSAGGRTYFVNRLTPSQYPATLKTVQIYFGNRTDGLRANAPITIIAGSSASNPVLYSAAVVQTGVLNAYTVSPLTITSGDFLVGFAVDNADGLYPGDLDVDSGSKRASYVSPDGVTFYLIDTLNASLAGNLGIRAVVSVPR